MESDLEGGWLEGWEVDNPPCFNFELQPSPLEQVRTWISKQRFIPCNLSNEFIMRFLNANCQNVEAATKMIQRYFYLRQEPWPIFRDMNPVCPANQKLFGHLYAVPLRNLFNDGEIILLTGLLQQSTRYSLLGHLKLVALTVEYLLWDKNNTFTDLKIILNGRNFTCPALLDNPYRHLEKFAKDFQSTLPIRFQGFYILQPPDYAKEVIRVGNGIYFTMFETPQELACKFPATILPFEFGGSLGLLDEVLDAWNLQMEQRRKFFVDFEKRMINDYRRRMCHERDVREGGERWVPRMRLVAEESEYKKRYYERMATFTLPPHKGFGDLRVREESSTDWSKNGKEPCALVDDSSSSRSFAGPVRGPSPPRPEPPKAFEIVFCIPQAATFEIPFGLAADNGKTEIPVSSSRFQMDAQT